MVLAFYELLLVLFSISTGNKQMYSTTHKVDGKTGKHHIVSCFDIYYKANNAWLLCVNITMLWNIEMQFMNKIYSLNFYLDW